MQVTTSLDQAAQASQPATDTIHLSVGHTLFVNTKSRVSRLYVGNPTALESYIVSPKQILLTAKAPGIVSVVLWDEKNQMQNYMISSELDLDPLRSALKGALPGERIAVEEHQGRVTLTGSVTTQVASDAAEKLAAQFTKDVVNSLNVNSTNAKQVQLKVRFVEVDRSRLNQYGINIFAPGPGNSVGSSGTSQFSSPATLTSGGTGTGLLVGGNTLTISNPLNFLFYSARAGVGVSVQDLENKEIVQILSEPTITTLNGQPASFLAGGEFPFPVVQGASTGATSITIQFRPYGVKLNFTPKVNEDGTIELKVSPEVSSLDYTNEVSISGYTIPAISTKHVDTQVVLRSGQSFAISGLLDRRTTDAFARTPGIANVPILGALFKSKGVNLSTSELIVVVTPTIVDPVSDSTPPAEPTTVRPFLNEKKFDTGFPTIHTP
ncbi:type II and III secretion system protein family protein [Granulicella sibirica]|uniref:type II and III secretion system protein family protein n=1 Tax=Granulicella sibirica TaxID=2479048 RepID=UPI00137649ED|nr:type II and III secretion system protein family protein [Granulicella sibirica]